MAERALGGAGRRAAQAPVPRLESRGVVRAATPQSALRPSDSACACIRPAGQEAAAGSRTSAL